jgi:hypothetical protein
MRQVCEVLRLKFVWRRARPDWRGAVDLRTTIKRFQAASLSWPLPGGLTDAALERGEFFPSNSARLLRHSAVSGARGRAPSRDRQRPPIQRFGIAQPVRGPQQFGEVV